MRYRLPFAVPALFLAACVTSTAVDPGEDTLRRDQDVEESDASDTDLRPDATTDTTEPDTSACTDGLMRCDGVCVDVTADGENCGVCGNLCPSLWLCEEGACVSSCSGTTTPCENGCVDTTGDRNNCGGCGVVCDMGEQCVEGSCTVDCGALSECGGDCVNVQSHPEHCGQCDLSCNEGQMCATGRCVCSGGRLACGDSCIDISADDQNCGGCGQVCEAGTLCEGGACVCTGGRPLCGDTCVDTSTDADNCGGCGVTCGAMQVCIDGACSDDCPDGLSVCDLSCVDLAQDTANCGACGTTCRADQFCDDGTCGCTAGETECGGVCVNLDTDPAACGACDNVCRADQLCTDGACDCEGALSDCGGVCIDTNIDDTNCGGCGVVCAADHVCGGGDCVCVGDTTECGGVCQDVDSDPMHCGGCDITCDPGDMCFEGGCISDCPSGLAACDETCVDTDVTAAHCGGCGNACDEGIACVDGECACSPDLLEPNNSNDTAYGLPIGDIDAGSIRDGILSNLTLCGDDHDVFQLGIPGVSSAVTVTMHGDCEDGSLHAALALTDDEGASIATATAGGTGSCPVLTTAVDGGYLFLDVNATDGTEGTYRLELDYGPFVEWESNDTTAAADGPFTREAAGRGSLEDVTATSSNDEDYWKIGLTHRTALTVQTTGPSGASCDGDTVITLFDDAGASLAIDDDGGTGVCSRIQNHYLNPGVYYVRVQMHDDHDSMWGDDTFAYQLQVDAPLSIEMEPNHLTVVADDFGAPPFSVEGGIQRPGDVDLFVLDIATDTALNIYARGAAAVCEADLQVRVLADDGTTVIASATDGLAANDRGAGACPLLVADDVAALNPLPAGSYFVEVSGDARAVGPYILNVLQ